MKKIVLMFSLFTYTTNSFSMHSIPSFKKLREAAAPLISPAIKTTVGLVVVDSGLRPLVFSLWKTFTRNKAANYVVNESCKDLLKEQTWKTLMKINLFDAYPEYNLSTFLLGLAAGLIVYDSGKDLIKAVKNVPNVLKSDQN
jgi:hypothetical protein